MSESNGKALTAEEIFGADDSNRTRVDIPEWEGCVYVQSLSGTHRDIFHKKQENNEPVRGWLVCVCAVNEDGKPIFTQQQYMQVGAKNGVAIDRIVNAVLAISGMTDEAVEELAGNLQGATSAGSGSD